MEAAIAQDNEVRLIDMFVDSLKLEDFGFKFDFMENGRPAYHPSVLLKLYIYGYLNRIRSSRTLEKECSRNIELMWLLKGLIPDHNTISNFRKDNPKAIRKVFRATVQLAAHFNLATEKLKEIVNSNIRGWIVLSEYQYGHVIYTPDDFRHSIALDGELDFREVDDASIAEVLSLAPFGNGNPSPLFAVRNVEVAGEPAIWKERNMRLKLRQNGRILTAKAWNFIGSRV